MSNKICSSKLELFHATPVEFAIEIMAAKCFEAKTCSSYSEIKEPELQFEKCVWLTKNEWFCQGNLFGNVQFSIDFDKLIEKCSCYLLQSADKKDFSIVILSPDGKYFNNLTEITYEEVLDIVKTIDKVNFIYLGDISMAFVKKISFVNCHQNSSCINHLAGDAACVFLKYLATGKVNIENMCFFDEKSNLSAGFNQLYRVLTRNIIYQKKVKKRDQQAKSIIRASIICSMYSKEDACNLISLFENETDVEYNFFKFWSDLLKCDIKEKFNIQE